MCFCLCSPCKLSITLVLLIWKIINSLFGLGVIFHSIWLLVCWFFYVLRPTPPHVFPAPNDNNNLLVFTEPMATSDKWNELNSRFIYALLVIGVIVCSITFLVHTATKNTSRHCSVYVVVIFLIILETLLGADMLFDPRWEKDIPSNAGTGLEGIRQFVEHNVKICKWFGAGVVAMQTQVLPLLFFINMQHEEFEHNVHEEFELNVHGCQPLLKEDSMDTEVFAGNSIFSSKISMDPNDSKTVCESV